MFRAGIIAFTSLLFADFTAANARSSSIQYHNPVIPGDHPDPSILRVGKEYWAASTSGDWGPYFELYRSADLVNWEDKGPMFEHRPRWANANFWAPEMTEYNGKFFVFYTARNDHGNLRVAVATADKPGGPYTDLGPIATPDSGSIDPAQAVDENGRRYLIWKSDGNANHLPTSIWAQPLDESGTNLLGKRTALIGNDADWEGPLVEAPFILKRGDWFYLFYSGSPCCGFGCHYAMGVARSHHLLGPWTKDPANPIMVGNKAWECPGHGSIVSDGQGRYFLFYHAYSPTDSYYSGRQAVLDEVKFGTNDWPTINDGQGPSASAPSPLRMEQKESTGFTADFSGEKSLPGWIWPRDHEPIHEVRDGKLILKPNPAGLEGRTVLFGRHASMADYTVTTSIETASLKTNSWAGIAIAGGGTYAFGIASSKNKFVVGERHGSEKQVLFEAKAPAGKLHYLKIIVRNGNRLWFEASEDQKNWMALNPNKEGLEMTGWNAPLQVVMTIGGAEPEGVFDSFQILPLRTTKAKK